MKRYFGIKALLAVAAAALCAGLLVSAGNADFRLGRGMEVLLNLYRELGALYVDEVDADKLLADAAEGMTSSLDPYTEYMPEEMMDDFEVQTTGKYGGIGSLIRMKGSSIVIARQYMGFPADRAGLRIGDRILSIDGKGTEGMTTRQASEMLRGEPGSTVALSVGKFASGTTEKIRIRRERIVISGVPYHGMASEGIGYIRHDDFSEDCADDLRKALEALRRNGELKGLVIDVRGNGGGILQQAVKILSLFVPKGTQVVSMRGRVAGSDAVFRTEGEPVDVELPIVVLCNGGSASASEIVAGAFQDLDRAVLLGQRTFGKGLVQSTRPLGYNAFLKVTTAKYYTPSGRCIQAVDYANRREDGSVGAVPDSLIREFKTLSGRTVYDGGGITPDVQTEARYAGRFVMTLYGMGCVEDFVDEYLTANPSLDVPVDDFRLPDGAYALFERFMRGRDMKFESSTRAALRELKSSAEREKYDGRVSELILSLESALPNGVSENLVLHRDDITRLIEDEIILRRHYFQGVIRHSLRGDEEVAAAVELLRDRERYRALLHPEKE